LTSVPGQPGRDPSSIRVRQLLRTASLSPRVPFPGPGRGGRPHQFVSPVSRQNSDPRGHVARLDPGAGTPRNRFLRAASDTTATPACELRRPRPRPSSCSSGAESKSAAALRPRGARAVDDPFYRLYLVSMKRLGVPPHPSGFFTQLAAGLSDQLVAAWVTCQTQTAVILLAAVYWPAHPDMGHGFRSQVSVNAPQ